MIRKFKSNNYIKGQLTQRLAGEDKKINFESPSRNIQIISFNTDDFSKQTLDFIYTILGINQYGLYRELHLCREILEGDIEGYTRMKKEHKTRETEKAIFIAGCWIPKSQIIETENNVFIKDWIFENNVCGFDFSKK